MQKLKNVLKMMEWHVYLKFFYTILPGYRPQPHKGMEYGDVAAEVKIGNKAYDLKGIIKRIVKTDLENLLMMMKNKENHYYQHQEKGRR